MRTLVFCTFGGMTQFLPRRTAPLKPMFRRVGCLEEEASGSGGSSWVIFLFIYFNEICTNAVFLKGQQSSHCGL